MFQKSKWANNDILCLIFHRACSYFSFRIRLSHFCANFSRIWTQLSLHCTFKIIRFVFAIQAKKFTYFTHEYLPFRPTNHSSRTPHRSFASSIYSSDISIPIDCRFILMATILVVPVPENGSSTVPSGGHVKTIGTLTKSSGYGAKWSFRPVYPLERSATHQKSYSL